MTRHCHKRAVLAFALLFSMAAAAQAEDLCFSTFNGTITYAFNTQQLLPVSGRSAGPLTGRGFGALAPCGTNGNLPLDGTVTFDGDNQLVFGWQVHSVDVGCGSVEFKVVLNLTTLQGPLHLWNTKNSFANTTTASVVACPA